VVWQWRRLAGVPQGSGALYMQRAAVRPPMPTVRLYTHKIALQLSEMLMFPGVGLWLPMKKCLRSELRHRRSEQERIGSCRWR